MEPTWMDDLKMLKAMHQLRWDFNWNAMQWLLNNYDGAYRSQYRFRWGP